VATMNGMHRLRELREDQGLSQRALAQLAGVAPATIVRAESGQRRPRGITTRKLARALGVEPVVLIRCGAPEALPATPAPRAPEAKLPADVDAAG